jgi:hypothetical protein
MFCGYRRATQAEVDGSLRKRPTVQSIREEKQNGTIKQ